MEITLLSKENTIGMYVENLEDLEQLFSQMSPSVNSFLSDCFQVTEYCE